MKRFINWLIDWFNEFSLKGKVSVIIGIICGVGAGLFIFISTDKIPATPSDYQPLEQQAEYFDENINLLIKENTNAEKVTVKFENDNCQVSVEYDSNLNKVKVTKEDNAIAWWKVLGLSVFVGVWMYFVQLLIIAALLIFLESLWKGFRKWKNDKQKRKK